MRNYVLIMGFLIFMIIFMSFYDGIRSDKVYVICFFLIKYYLIKVVWYWGYLYFFFLVWSFICLFLFRLCLNFLLYMEYLNGSWLLCICKMLYI